MELVDAVLDGCASEDEGVSAAQAFDGLGGFGVPVLDALGFVEHDDVRAETGVDVKRVAQHLLVIDDSEEGWGGRLACLSRAGILPVPIREGRRTGSRGWRDT